ncbi:hypothetical protein [Candidatus Solirubrobacter pratensis]|uniref:hypothetical protein n=1 Tax=Candidatus Solirubrobacter pratensis TaxID=1298857 RepID=UPI00040C7185|nr:hypothetical protein [Candidatus Solirubrobacter pratensis]
MATGTVIDLWRWPVLGMYGEQLISTRIDALGVAGDRVHRAEGAGERLARWRAGYPFTPGGAIEAENPPYPTVTSPRERNVYRWGDPRLIVALERDLRCRIRPVRDLETPRGVIVATEPPAGDAGHAGVNVQLDLDPPPGGWSGTELEFEHGVRLRLFNSRADGPGIEARVLTAGRVQLGEGVALG